MVVGMVDGMEVAAAMADTIHPNHTVATRGNSSTKADLVA